MAMLDPETCYEAMRSRDTRFDGWFFAAVSSTGIYCRPSCPAMMPRREHVSFYPTAAAAQQAGYRACLRCRPDAAPGSPHWNARADVAGRAMRLIADGVVDRDGVDGLARRLAYSPRQLRRLLRDELGAGPLSLARAQRAQTARLLIETTDLPFGEVAFAAGFASLRQFNDTVRAVFARPPRDLRRRASAARATPAGTAGLLVLRLPRREPFDAAGLLAFFAARAVPGLEEVAGGALHRSLRLPRGEAVVALTPRARHVEARLRLSDLRDLGVAVSRCRALMDLDADPVAVDALLGRDPILAPLIQEAPGVRVPGAADGAELAVRAVLGQQISVAAARTVAASLVERLGTPLARPEGSIRRVFPTSETLLDADPALFPMPRSRVATVKAVAASLADGGLVLDGGADRDEARARLLALPGVGPWTVEYVAMRALGDPDAFPATDLGVLHALAKQGTSGAPASPAAADEAARGWRPWRAYAVQHLWRVRP